MIFITCTTCATAIRVAEGEETDFLVGSHSELATLSRGYRCPSCSAQMQLTQGMDPISINGLNIHDLTAQEAFAAFNGLGFPEERDCGPEAVSKCFEKEVKNIQMSWLKNTSRTHIEYVEFEDGTKMYFGAAPQGAVIYRIAPPRSFTQEALNGA